MTTQTHRRLLHLSEGSWSQPSEHRSSSRSSIANATCFVREEFRFEETSLSRQCLSADTRAYRSSDSDPSLQSDRFIKSSSHASHSLPASSLPSQLRGTQDPSRCAHISPLSSSRRPLATRNQLRKHHQHQNPSIQSTKIATHHADVIPVQQNLRQLSLIAVIVASRTRQRPIPSHARMHVAPWTL